MENEMNTNELNPDFKYEVAAVPGGDNIKKCFACGTCTAGCPVFHVETRFNPRKIIRMILLGMREQVLSSKAIWYCVQCYTCSANCPQDVDFSDIIFALQNLAIKEGYAPAGLRDRIRKITSASYEFRRDCIKLVMNEENVSAEQIMDNTAEKIAGFQHMDNKDDG